MHVTSTQVLTIPVILEGQATASQDTDIVFVTETVEEPLATAFVTSSITSKGNGKVETAYITVTLEGGEVEAVTQFIDVMDGQDDYTVTLTLEESDGQLTVVTRTIDIISQDANQILAATKTVNQELAY